MLKKEQQETCIADDQAWISSWLQHADHQKYDEGLSELGDMGIIEPITPLRQAPLMTYYEEMSPATTSFSGGSIFDTPRSSGDSWIEDPFCNDVPDTAPANDQGCSWDKTKRHSTRLVRTHPGTVHSDVSSLASYDPPTGVADVLEEDTDLSGEALKDTAAPPIDPDKPRIVFITSCTQCILANLPCSRTIPHCSRCRRNGQAALCLLHRRKFLEEISRSDASSCTTPVLLKLKGEDEGVWKKKLRLAGQVCATTRILELSLQLGSWSGYGALKKIAKIGSFRRSMVSEVILEVVVHGYRKHIQVKARVK
mgnify:CR=1 FL=1